MSSQARRTLRIDDPVAGDACHGHGRARLRARVATCATSPCRPFTRTPLSRATLRPRVARCPCGFHPGAQPIIVQPRSGGGYELIAGERRWRASKIAGVATIPALVAPRVDGAQSIEIALIENVARDDLGVIEEARTIATLLDELDVTATCLARRLGRSRSDLPHTFPLLDLPDEAIDLIDASELSKSHGKVLLTESDHCRSPGVLLKVAGQCARSKRRSHGHRSRVLDLLSRIPIKWRLAARLHDLFAQATGCEIEAHSHRLGYQLILDQGAIDWLKKMLLPAGDEN